MLTQHAQTTLIPTAQLPRVQTGLVYACPVCGQPVLGLVPWPVSPSNPCKLDEWAAHIWYLRRKCGCRTGGRVARLGNYITPLEFTYDRSLTHEQRVEANIAALQAALALLTACDPQGAAVPNGPHQGDADGHAP